MIILVGALTFIPALALGPIAEHLASMMAEDNERKGQNPVPPSLNGRILRQAVVDAFVKLNPLHLIKNPVMFVVEVGSILTTLLFFQALFGQARRTPFILAISLWLWFTLLFANFAEAMAEGRGKAQARSLRRRRRDVTAKLLTGPDPKRTAASLPVRSSRRGISFWWKPVTSFPATGRWSSGSPPSMKAPSPGRAPR